MKLLCSHLTHSLTHSLFICFIAYICLTFITYIYLTFITYIYLTFIAYIYLTFITYIYLTFITYIYLTFIAYIYLTFIAHIYLTFIAYIYLTFITYIYLTFIAYIYLTFITHIYLTNKIKTKIKQTNKTTIPHGVNSDNLIGQSSIQCQSRYPTCNTYVYDNLLSCVGTGTLVVGLSTSFMALYIPFWLNDAFMQVFFSVFLRKKKNTSGQLHQLQPIKNM